MEHNNVGENRAKNVEQGENAFLEERSGSCSVSSASAASATSEFSFEDPYQIVHSRKEHGSFALDPEQPEQGLLQSDTLAADTGSAPAAIEGSQPTLESPPTVQVMERPSDPSAYRIPSYVFARNKSSTPNPDWSTASNESLFSIHTGNMSFTRDQFSWLLKSGELGMYGTGDIRKSGELGKVNDIRSAELPPPSPKVVQKPEELKTVDIYKSGEQMPASSPEERKSGEQTPTMTPDIRKSGEHIIAAHFKTSSNSPSGEAGKLSDVRVSTSRGSKVSDIGVTTPRASDVATPDFAAGSKKEDLKQRRKDKMGTKPSIDEIPLSASVSHHSDASGQSFAFPVFGEIDREKSVNSGVSRVDQTKDSSRHEQEGQSKTTPEGTRASSWFACFSCCSCC